MVVASREDAQDPARLAQRIADSACTVMQATPATWRSLIHAGWRGSANLKVLCGGEALLPDLARDLLSRCAELWNMYGPTETTVWSTLHPVTTAEGVVPIGRPIANTQVYVLDAQRNLVPAGTVGELYIGGDGLARGYWRREELTRERFVPSPFVPDALLYRTGDLARFLADGTLECLGRVDTQVKIRGFRIELGEIEALLSSHPAIRQCAVIAREDTGLQTAGRLFRNQAKLHAPTATDLRAYVEKELPAYMVPSVFVAMEKLPLTPNGKIDRKALPAPTQRVAVKNEFVAPRDATEQLLAQIWANVLKVKRVGLHDNFFDLGGHSLLAVRIMVEIEKHTNIRLPLATLLHAPTIADLAAILRNRSGSPPGRRWFRCAPPAPGRRFSSSTRTAAMCSSTMRWPAIWRPTNPSTLCRPAAWMEIFARDLTLEKMAAAYIEEMQTASAGGPVFPGRLLLRWTAGPGSGSTADRRRTTGRAGGHDPDHASGRLPAIRPFRHCAAGGTD